MIKRAHTRAVVGALVIAIIAPCWRAPEPANAAGVGLVPAQWVAKQYTELLGRAPGDNEWAQWLTAFEHDLPCNASGLAQMGSTLARSVEFEAAYPSDSPGSRGARVTALSRAAFARDPDPQIWSAFFAPYDAGAVTWDGLVSAVYADPRVAALVPSVCDSKSSAYGFGTATPLDLKAATSGIGSRSQAELQAAIDATAATGGGTVLLEPGELIRVGGNDNANRQLVVKPGVTLSTAGTPTPRQYARMGRLVVAQPGGAVCSFTSCDHAGLVALEPGASLRNVWVDPSATTSTNERLSGVDTLGSGASTPTNVTDNRVAAPARDGAAIRANGFSTSGSDCTQESIVGNLVTGYTSHAELDVTGSPQAVDGLEISCEGTSVAQNTVVDVTDIGIILYGSYNRSLAATRTQRSVLTGNTIVSAGLDASAAIAADATGECFGVSSGPIAPCIDVPDERSFVGTDVRGNSFWTSPRAELGVGLLVGGAPRWGDHRVTGIGASFRDNTTGGVGARTTMGISVLGMKSTSLSGNTDQYTLVDANPASTWGKCPLVDVGIGSQEVQTLQPGAQEALLNDDADGCLVPQPSPTGLERVVVAPDRNRLVGATTNAPFVPYGTDLNTSVEDLWRTDWSEVVSRFREVKRMGANTVRLLLQFSGTMAAPSPGYPNGTPITSALETLADVARLAEQTGLYLDVTGLGIELDGDSDTWYDALDETSRWASQAVYWSSVAATLRNSNAVAWYDLMNEPALAPGTTWCVGIASGLCFAQRLTKDVGTRSTVDVARLWFSQMRTAIRGAADNHQISVGLLPSGYSGFRPADLADLEDLANVHIYPRADDPTTPENELDDDIRAAKASKPATQPFVVEETFTLYAPGPDLRSFVLGSRPEATGWLGHYTARTPAQMTPPADERESEYRESLTTFLSMRTQVLHTDRTPVPPGNGTVVRGTPSGGLRMISAGCPTGGGASTPSIAYTISDQDLAALCPSVSVADSANTEGASSSTRYLSYTVSLTTPSNAAVAVGFTTANGTALAGSDYTATSGTLAFAPGETSKCVRVALNGDTTVEPDETVRLRLSNPSGVVVGRAEAIGTIRNDDTPTLSIGDIKKPEGNSGTTPFTFTVTLSQASAVATTVKWATANGSATAPTDYTAASGSLSLPAGATTGTITVNGKGDTAIEPNETFSVVLSSPVTATIADGTALATITDDDGPTVAIGDVTKAEGNSGTTAFAFAVTLSKASTATTTVQWATANTTASAPNDYAATSGQLSIPAGTTTKTVTVNVVGDTTFEAAETFAVNLSGPVNAFIADGSGRATITNDDTAPTLKVGDLTKAEGNSGTTTFSVPVTLSKASGVTTSVHWSTADNSAISPTDYAALSGTLSIPPGSASGTITVNVAGDTLYENNETFTVNLSGPVNASVADGAGLATITNDDTAPTLTIDDVTKAEGNSGVAAFTFTVTLSKASAKTATAQWATNNGTAAAGSDYTAAAGTLSIPAGSTSGTITVSVAGDTLYETSETFTVNLSNPVDATIADGTGVATITSDDSPATLSIDDVSKAEGDTGTTSFIFTVTLSQPSGVTTTVDWATADGTATAPNDYTAATGTLSIPAGSTSGTFAVTAAGDVLSEADETITVTLSAPVNATIAHGTGIATITDDDAPPMVTVGDVAAAEGSAGTTSYAFTVTLSRITGQPTTVAWTTADGTADAGSDYTAATGILTIPAGAATATIVVDVTGDAIYENNETFTVNLSNADNAIIADSTGLATINNDDTAPTLTINDISAAEGNSGTTAYTFTVTLSKTSGATTTFTWATTNGTAVAGIDYTAATGTFSIPTGITTMTATVNANGDPLYENNETFTVNLSNAVNAIIADSTGLATINNDDTAPTLTINDISAAEGNSGTTAYTFTVTLSKTSGATTTFAWATANGTAAAGSDYSSGTATRTIAAGATTATVTINVIGDVTVEPNETFNVNLSNPVNATIADGTGVGTIANDDSGPVLTIKDLTKAEGNSGTTPFAFTVTLSRANTVGTTVAWTTVNGTASTGTDYAAGSGTLTIPAGATTGTVTVNTFGDTLYEGNEAFNVKLSGAVNAAIADGTGVATIANDDAAPTLSIGSLVKTEGDGGITPFTFTLTLSKVSGLPTSVLWATSNGTAVAPGDLTAASGYLEIPAGATSTTIGVNVIGDSAYESDETFTVTISSPDATIVSATATGTLVNDDAMPVLTLGNLTKLEGNAGTTSFVFPVNQSAASGVTTTVQWATVGDTATVGSDYISSSGTLTFTPGSTTKNITVNVLGDTAFENDEAFTVILSAPSNAAIAGGTATGTITNDDSAPTLSIDDSVTNEGDSDTEPLTFTILLSAPSGLPTTVHWATVDATATAGDDYVAASGTLTFPAGVTSRTVSADARGDTFYENDETFVIDLSSPVNATVTDGNGVGTIANDDEPPSITVDNAEAAEGESGSTLLTFTVTLSASSGLPTTMLWATNDDTAFAPVDYTVGSGLLTIPPGTTSGTITVVVLGDTTYENDETFAVDLSTSVNGALEKTRGIGTITNDDAEL